VNEPLPKFDRFSVLEVLGRGTTGTIYKARDDQYARLVAIKSPFLPSDSDQYWRERFMREVHMVACCEHPNIARAFEVHENQGVPFFVREFVDGKTLEQLVGGGYVGLCTSVRILRDAARTIQHIHEHGLVHRNLHPANVLVATTGDVKMIGFGRAGAFYVDQSLFELDFHALHGMLRWLCETIEHPMLTPLNAVPPPTSMTKASELADALTAWLERTKGK
jgi:serine/threonine protein kinase